MSEKLFCPSLMCADFDNLKKEVQSLDKSGADIFHIDIMDGSFVPNFGMGIQDIKTVRNSTDKLIDVHLMIVNPDKYIDLFSDLGVDIIYIHPEGNLHPTRTLNKIRERGKKVGLAISPGTSVSNVKPLLHLIDYLMVMTVSPGFSGQKFLQHVENKIDYLLKLKSNYNFELLVDGAISPEKIELLGNRGVNGFVLGTSALFNHKESYHELIMRYKSL